MCPFFLYELTQSYIYPKVYLFDKNFKFEEKMSAIWNSLGLAILGIALLMGSAAGVDAGCDVTGCLMPDGYLELEITSDSVDLGTLPAVNKDGGSLKVLAWDSWEVTVEDVAGYGKLAKGTTRLTNPLVVNNDPLTPPGPMAIAGTSGQATGDCVQESVPIEYDQSVTSADTTGGMYTISLIYTLYMA
jgi:hypothetical protein